MSAAPARTTVFALTSLAFGIAWIGLMAVGVFTPGSTLARASWFGVSVVLVASNVGLAYEALAQLRPALHFHARSPAHHH